MPHPPSCLTSAAVVIAMLNLGSTSAESQRVQCGTRSTAPCSAPNITFLQVSAGQFHSCGVSQDGSAWCWGDGREGALGDGKATMARLPQRVSGPTLFVEVQAGGEFSCGRSVQNAIWCWGKSQAVPGWPEVQRTPIEIPFNGNARSLTLGRRHACVLDDEGQAGCWGFNADGETGTGVGGVNAALVPEPTPVATDQRFTSLSAGLGFTCGVTTTGAVLCWGSNIDGIVGEGALERCGDVAPIPCTTHPVEVRIPERATQVSSGASHACAVTVTGAVFCWGSNGVGQSGAYSTAVRHIRMPVQVTVPWSGPFVAVSSGGIHTCAMANSRKVYCWGADQLSMGEDIEPEMVAPRVAAGGTQFQSISAGSLHACGLDQRGRVLCWGDTIRGALGIR